MLLPPLLHLKPSGYVQSYIPTKNRNDRVSSWTVQVAVKQTKAHKTRGVLRLTLRELSMYNEQDKVR